MTTSPPPLDYLREQITGVMWRDQHRLQRRLHDARRLLGDKRDSAAAKLTNDVATALLKVAHRTALLPTISYPDLPITARREELLEVIANNQVVIVAGETGSGKSTQLPKLCLELGRGVRGLIGHTQPRRVAARAVAERVAEELGSEIGQTVGYAVRFTDRVGDDSLVKVMTDGILLAETQRDRWLSAYDTLIIDEAHERSLNIDFLLGYLHQLLPKRPELKVIITSATIDTHRFAEHFGAPIVEISGRTYPVELRYRPFGVEPEDERDQVAAICEAVEELSYEGQGDVLVFLSGEREIHDVADALRKQDLTNTEILPLYARLSSAEQHRVFQPHAGRRIVLSTNVAETSLTVPGVRYVVDAGTARISRYSRRLKVQRLPIEPVSQASANQRSGRCGRVAPGIAIRLYEEKDFNERDEFTEPEILRTNLASVILQMTALGLGDVGAFPFVDPPDPRSVSDGIALLEELGALTPNEDDPKKRLTPLGRRLATLPVDPRLGRMILEADRLGCAREVLIIASALSIQDPRERPADKQQAAEEMHRRFATEGSDFLSFVRLFDHLRERQRELTNNQFRKLCRTEFLNYLRIREWQDLFSQLRQVASSLDIRMSSEAAHLDQIHQALLSGLLSQIGMKDPTGKEFRGARNAKFMVGRGSVVATKSPKWVMAGELVETNRLWARVCAPIQPAWAERLGEHLVKRSYGEPEWSAERGTTMVIERVSLYGLPIVAGRNVQYGRIDQQDARSMFIHFALVEGDWDTHHDFMENNRSLVAEVRSLEDRLRRQVILVDDNALYDFYDERLPHDITSSRDFDRWWKKEKGRKPEMLTLTREYLVKGQDDHVPLDDFPTEWQQDDLIFGLSYVFDPGAANDGVTVHIPLAVLNQVEPVGFEWLVPGVRLELMTSLLKSLPKTLRRELVPLSDFAQAATVGVAEDGPLLPALAAHLSAKAGVTITARDFQLSAMTDHSRITFAVHETDGAIVDFDKDLNKLKARLRKRTRAAIAEATPVAECTGLTDWPGGHLEKVVDATTSGGDVRGYPSLVAEADGVAVRVLTTPEAQERAMIGGTRRLLELTLKSPTKIADRAYTNEVKLALASFGWGTTNKLTDECVRGAIEVLLTKHGGPVWNEEDFRRLQKAVQADLDPVTVKAAITAGQIMVAAVAASSRIDALVGPLVQDAQGDARSQLARLIRPGFVSRAGTGRLADVLRYARGIEHRMAKIQSEPEKDRVKMRTVHRLEEAFDRLLDAIRDPERRSRLAEVGWMIEEFRISLFAQSLGTAYTISEKRVITELQRVASGG